MPHNLAEAAKMIALGDSELNKHPIYIMQVIGGSECESQQLQQPEHQVQLQLPQQQ